jgi:hypothetical protein
MFVWSDMFMTKAPSFPPPTSITWRWVWLGQSSCLATSTSTSYLRWEWLCALIPNYTWTSSRLCCHTTNNKAYGDDFSRILNFSARWKRIASFPLQSLYIWRNAQVSADRGPMRSEDVPCSPRPYWLDKCNSTDGDRSWWNFYLRSWALLKKPSTVQLLKNFPAFHGTRRFITVFTRALHWSLSWATPIQSTPIHRISPRSILILFTHLSLCLPNFLFRSIFPPISYMNSSSPPFMLHALSISSSLPWSF